MSRATDFFTSTVKPTADEFLSDTRDIRRGRLAAIVLYHMADYWQLENKTTFNTLSILRDELINKCQEFSIIMDVADASKHGQLTRPTRKLSSSEQITMAPGLFEAPFGVGVFNEALEVIVTLDDGTSRPFIGVVQSVLSMWEMMLQ